MFRILPLHFNHGILVQNHMDVRFEQFGKREYYGYNKIVDLSFVHEKVHSTLFKTKPPKP